MYLLENMQKTPFPLMFDVDWSLPTQLHLINSQFLKIILSDFFHMIIYHLRKYLPIFNPSEFTPLHKFID